MSPEEAWLMVSMMKDVVQRGTAAGSVGSQFKIPAGGKTGTTNDGADVWYIGYTSDLVAGVWMGLDKPKKIKGNAQGGVLAAPAWTAFMREVYRRRPASQDWPRPEGIVERQIDYATGQLWAPGCGPAIYDYFLAGTDPIATCIPPAETYPTTPGTPGQPTTSPVDTSFGFPAPTSPRAAPRHEPVAHSRVRGDRLLAGSRAGSARAASATCARQRRRRSGAHSRRHADPSRHEQPVHASPVAAPMTWQPVDCHAHSTHSDGALSVADVVEKARTLGVRPSVTDHISHDAPTTVDSPRAVARYLDDLEEYDVLRSGEFCWHDTLWRELPPETVRRFSHRVGSLHSIRLASGDYFRVFHRELPAGLTPEAYVEAHVSSLEALAAEMPIDVFAHPTLISPSLRHLDPHEFWSEAHEDRLGARVARGRDRVRDLEPLSPSPPHRPSRRRGGSAAVARLRRSFARAGRRRGASAFARTRRGRARRGSVRSHATRLSDRRLRRMTRYHARWVVPVSAPPIARGTLVEREGRIAWVGPRDDAPALAGTATTRSISATRCCCRVSSTRTATSSSRRCAAFSTVSRSASGFCA
jgi:histidinol phosphatase-like PHP family hydrolase